MKTELGVVGVNLWTRNEGSGSGSRTHEDLPPVSKNHLRFTYTSFVSEVQRSPQTNLSGEETACGLLKGIRRFRPPLPGEVLGSAYVRMGCSGWEGEEIREALLQNRQC